MFFLFCIFLIVVGLLSSMFSVRSYTMQDPSGGFGRQTRGQHFHGTSSAPGAGDRTGRQPSDGRKKMFSDDQGEYVEYEEL